MSGSPFGIQWNRLRGDSLLDGGGEIGLDSSGNIWATARSYGRTFGPKGDSGGGPDSFGGLGTGMGQFSPQGNFLWGQMMSTQAVPGTANQVYGTGMTMIGDQPVQAGLIRFDFGDGTYTPGNDSYVYKYNTDGSRDFATIFGSERVGGNGGWDNAQDVAADASGNLYVAGYTDDSMGGGANAGSNDIWIRKYEKTGANSYSAT